jgi:hypothetical protein
MVDFQFGKNVFVSHDHNAPEDFAGAMGCFPTGNFMKPILIRRLRQYWKCRNRRNVGAIDDQLNTELWKKSS